MVSKSELALLPNHKFDFRIRVVRTHAVPAGGGADNQARTGDLILTKDVLCLLSYISKVI